MIRNLSIQGPGVDLEQLIQLRHAAKNIKRIKNLGARSSTSGKHRSIFRGRGMDFEEVRIYQTGDDIRSIDWKVTARTQKTYTKIFREEKEQPVLLAVDQGPSMFFGSKVTYKSVMAAELASLLAWSTLQDQDKIGGLVFNSYQHAEIKPKRSKHALLALLKKMVDFNKHLFEENPGPVSSSIHKALEKLCHLVKPGCSLYIISDFLGYDEEAERLLYIIKRHTNIYALVIADNMEENLPIHPQLNFTDGMHKLLINTDDKKILEAYQQSFHTRQKSLIASFNKLGIRHRRIWTHDNPGQALQAMFNSSANITAGSNNIDIHAA